MTITNIQQQLERDEGKILHSYKDSRGFWTIGIGHLLGDTIPSQFANGITDSQCSELFSADLQHTISLMNIYIPWWSSLDGPTGPRSGVLLNMAFNLGVKGLAGFHGFLGYMHDHNWLAAAADLAGTAVYKQLPQRYSRLKQQILSGTWV